MPIGAGIGEAEEDYGYLRGDLVTGVEFGSAGFGGFWPSISVGRGGYVPPIISYYAPPTAIPDIYPTVTVGPTSSGDSADNVDDPISPAQAPTVIDPGANPTATVFEQGGLIDEFPNPFQNTAPTDWDAVYDQYVILNAPSAPDIPVPEVVIGEAPVAIDWGEVLGNIGGSIVGGLFDPLGLRQPTQNFIQGAMSPVPTAAVATAPVPPGGVAMAANGTCGPGGPRYGKICLATGVVTPLKQRRRRRLLTASDINDLAALKALVGNSAGMQAAVVKAVRR